MSQPNSPNDPTRKRSLYLGGFNLCLAVLMFVVLLVDFAKSRDVIRLTLAMSVALLVSHAMVHADRRSPKVWSHVLLASIFLVATTVILLVRTF